MANAQTTPPGGSAPVISGTPPTHVLSREPYEFLPTATDADRDRLVFSVENLPPWATFRTTSGKITGRAKHAQVGEYIDIRISVSDGQHVVSLPPFSITVGQGNRRPVISGTPPAGAVERQAYAFTPTARDRDGDALSFSIVNKPAWASFNEASGALTGTPGIGAVGAYGDIAISVSDGTLDATLTPFRIAVEQGALGSATLNWLPPTTRSDGSPLTNLAGYRVRYGTAVGSYPNSLTIQNPGLTSAVVSDLQPATYYFVMSAYDTLGLESSLTTPVSKTIPW